jgi:hypothetical protein
MNVEEYLLTCLNEESLEIAHAVNKAKRFGLDDINPDNGLTNREHILKEFNDQMGVFDMLIELGVFETPLIRTELVVKKREKLNIWMTYSRSKGTLVN